MKKIYSRLILNALACVAFWAALPWCASAQLPISDSKGKDFWLAYLPNYHNYMYNSDDIQKYGDSLFIFIAAEKPTKGTISYTQFDGTVVSTSFQITDPKDVYVFKTTYFYSELRGYNSSGILAEYDNQQCEKVRNNTFHVSSDEDITIYGHSQAVTTSEAFIVLPTDALGKLYYVLTYTSDDSPDKEDQWDSRTPSQFAVVATEDSTEVTITPSAATYANGLTIQTVRMNKGQVYLVQTALSKVEFNKDLTGSRVESTKPVAVFAGHQRATVPLDRGISRDCLIEQMPPVESWGTNAIIVPFHKTSYDPNYYNDDRYRILSASDDNVIEIAGLPSFKLNKGKFYEADLSEPAAIKASAPILVMEYKKTAGINNGDNGQGDPLMMVIPPVEQFSPFYRCINVQTYEAMNKFGGGYTYEKIYNEQYITVVTNGEGIKSAKIDEVAIPQSLFIRVPNSDYYYYHATVRDGVHTVDVPAGSGIYVYGYGTANSYGYFGGMNLKKLDFNPPKIQSERDCLKLRGVISDSSTNDSGIMEVQVPAAKLANMIVKVDDFLPYQKVVKYTAEMIDPYSDGSFDIIAYDSARHYSSFSNDVSGFTYAVKGVGPAHFIPEYKDSSSAAGEFCFDIVIENYGKWANQDFTITKLLSNSGKFYIKNPKKINIAPGRFDTVTVCYHGQDTVGLFTDTLLIGNNCFDRKVAAITMMIKKDVDPPSIQTGRDSCARADYVNVSESQLFDTGISRIDILDSVNCSVKYEKNDLRESRLIVEVKDRYLDAIYALQATDRTGKTTTKRDTIQGLTLAVSGMNGRPPFLDFGSKELGTLTCDTFMIRNYGIKPIIIDNMFLAGNLRFSVPQSQLPLRLVPGDSALVAACYRPGEVTKEEQTDSIMFGFNCLSRVVNLSGHAEQLEMTGASKCGRELKIVAKKVSDRFYLGNAKPNPVAGAVTFTFGLPVATGLDVTISDMFGKIIYSSHVDEAAAGEYEFTVDAGNYPAGVYAVIISGSNGSRSAKFSVVK